MNRSDAADRLERLLRRDLDEAAREAGSPDEDEIDAYVEGRASAAEREVIESWLADDPALKAEVDALIAMRQTIEGEGTSQTLTGESRAWADSIPREASTRARVSPGAQAPRGAQKPPRAATPVRETTRQMRARPMRTAALLALAASLAFFTLWVVSPGRPPVDSEIASGGSTPPSAVPAPGDASSGTRNPAAGGTASGGGSAGSGAAPAATLTLRDAGGDVSLLANGEIRGLEGLDASNRSAVARALTSGRLEMAAQIETLAASASVLRAPAPGDAGTPAGAPVALRVVRPLATAVRTVRPTFEWTAIPGASAYRVRIADAALEPVVESPTLTTTRWTPDTPLPVGRVLMWQIEAETPQGAIVAPAPPASEARFRVLPDTDAQALTRALDAAKGSDLASAVILARFGVLDEADAALVRLAAANRDAAAIAGLRRQLSDRRFPR